MYLVLLPHLILHVAHRLRVNGSGVGEYGGRARGQPAAASPGGDNYVRASRYGSAVRDRPVRRLSPRAGHLRVVAPHKDEVEGERAHEENEQGAAHLVRARVRARARVRPDAEGEDEGEACG